MAMKQTTPASPWKPFYLFPVLSLCGALLLMVGCDGDSAETLLRTLGIRVNGFYTNDGGRIVANNTGAPITSLNIRQSGDQLDATDNNGIIFRGTVGQESESEASITLNGQTTVGQAATISGRIRVAVGSSDATLSGSWIEESLFSTVSATATVPENSETTSDNNTTDNGTGNAGTTNNNTNTDTTDTSDDGTTFL